MSTATVEKIGPQPGPQTAALACPADIMLYGGAVFAGKTFYLLIEALRFIQAILGFGAVIFRRQHTQITAEGGIWHEAVKLYGPFKPSIIQNPLRLTFPPHGNRIEFHHLNQPGDVSNWDGSQIPLIGFDELQHFVESQFWYMLSRNRTDCGVKAYCRATCNPPGDREHWLTKLVAWWLDSDGWPIPERSGVIRYFVRIDNVVHWADTPEELHRKFPGPETFPKSFTFISGNMDDNKIGLSRDPGYAGNVAAQVESERLRMRGNWFAMPTAGELFDRTDFEIIEPEEVPSSGLLQSVRYWDRAGTEPSEVNSDPDYTVGARCSLAKDGTFYVEHIDRFRLNPGKVVRRVKMRTKIDRAADVTCVLEEDPGQAGKAEIVFYAQEFAGLPFDSVKKTASKITTWRPLSYHVRRGMVKLVRGEWLESFLSEAERVIDGTQNDRHDDQIDAVAGAFMYLTSGAGRTGFQGGASLNVF